MIIAQYFVEFIFYSFLGWVWESIYCTLMDHHWQDRGFLFGPICPIYGSCVVVAQLVFRYMPGLSGPGLPLWAVFLVCVVGSAIAEFCTSWILEMRFHARWWDYSKLPLNIQGRICLPVSLCFGAAGVVIVKYLLPLVTSAHSVLPGLAYEGVALGFALVLGGDFALTEASLSALLNEIEAYHQEFNVRAQSVYERFQAAPETLAEGLASKKADFQEEALERRALRENDRAELGRELKEKREELERAAAARRQEMEDAAASLQDRREELEALAARRAASLSAGSRHALRNMVAFHPFEEAGENAAKKAGEKTGEKPVLKIAGLTDRSPAERLKEALRKLEEK